MSKRKNQDTIDSTSASKKMPDQQGESSVSPPEENVFHYHQDHITVTSLYLATKLADVHFAFDSDDETVTRMPAHKTLLAAASDVFEKMFYGELKESGDVKIVDASEAAFKEFLQFFYLNEVKLSAKHVGSVLYLGNKYNVENCVDACVKFLTDDLSNENVCAALSLAILHEQKELMKVSEKQILLNTADIFKTAGFLECSKEALAHILKMNQLVFSCSETNIFEACMEWVRAKSKQPVLSKAIVEQYLGKSYYQIRFASMTPQEFCDLETKYSAVLASDFKDIIRLINRVDIDSEHFNASPRQMKWNEDADAIIGCDRDIYPSPRKFHALDIEEKMTFSTIAPLMLGEFVSGAVFFGKKHSKNLRSDLSVEVTITEASTLDDVNGKVLCSMTANLLSYVTPVALPQPILIRPNLYYTIRIKGFPEGHYFVSVEQEESVTLESDIQIEFHNDKVVNGKIVGLIYLLEFNKIL